MDALDALIAPSVRHVLEDTCPCGRRHVDNDEWRAWFLEGIRQRDRSRLNRAEDEVRVMGPDHRHNVALWLHNTLERMPKTALTYDDDFRAVANLLRALWTDLCDQSTDPEDPFGMFPDPAIVDP